MSIQCVADPRAANAARSSGESLAGHRVVRASLLAFVIAMAACGPTSWLGSVSPFTNRTVDSGRIDAKTRSFYFGASRTLVVSDLRTNVDRWRVLSNDDASHIEALFLDLAGGDGISDCAADGGDTVVHVVLDGASYQKLTRCGSRVTSTYEAIQSAEREIEALVGDKGECAAHCTMMDGCMLPPGCARPTTIDDIVVVSRARRAEGIGAPAAYHLFPRSRILSVANERVRLSNEEVARIVAMAAGLPAPSAAGYKCGGDRIDVRRGAELAQYFASPDCQRVDPRMLNTFVDAFEAKLPAPGE